MPYVSERTRSRGERTNYYIREGYQREEGNEIGHIRAERTAMNYKVKPEVEHVKEREETQILKACLLDAAPQTIAFLPRLVDCRDMPLRNSTAGYERPASSPMNSKIPRLPLGLSRN